MTEGFIEEAVAEAIFAAECIHGPARVRLGTRYYLVRRRSHLVLDTGSGIREHAAQLVVGILTRRLGEDGFRVERLNVEVAA